MHLDSTPSATVNTKTDLCAFINSRHTDASHVCAKEKLICDRYSVNTRNSILHLNEEENEDDDDITADDSYVTFEDLHLQTENQNFQTKDASCCHYNFAQAGLIESFLDGLCGSLTSNEVTSIGYREAVEVDFLHMLGCSNVSENNGARWYGQYNDRHSQPRNTMRPPRKDNKQRATSLFRLQQERLNAKIFPGIGPRHDASRARSLDQGLRGVVNRDLDTTGYDSDPEFKLLKSSDGASFESNNSTSKHISGQDGIVSFACINETLNTNWRLIFHDPKGCSYACRVWMERGMLIDSRNRMLEPSLLWLPAVQSQTDAVQSPTSVRLLNIFRIIPAERIDRSLFPLARPLCCFKVHTADDGIFLFQAESKEEMHTIMTCWKQCVARFAALAVVEDMDTIAEEYFLPNNYRAWPSGSLNIE